MMRHSYDTFVEIPLQDISTPEVSQQAPYDETRFVDERTPIVNRQRHRWTFFGDPWSGLSRQRKIAIALALLIGIGVPLIILLRYLFAPESEPYAPSTTPAWNTTGFFSTTPDSTSAGAPTTLPETTALPDTTTMPDTTPVTTPETTATPLPPDPRCVPPQIAPDCCNTKGQFICGAKQ